MCGTVVQWYVSGWEVQPTQHILSSRQLVNANQMAQLVSYHGLVLCLVCKWVGGATYPTHTGGLSCPRNQCNRVEKQEAPNTSFIIKLFFGQRICAFYEDEVTFACLFFWSILD